MINSLCSFVMCVYIDDDKDQLNPAFVVELYTRLIDLEKSNFVDEACASIRAVIYDNILAQSALNLRY